MQQFVRNSDENLENFKMATEQMANKLDNNPELCEKLIPKWELGCRRVTPGEGYLESFLLPNVHLRQSSIKQITKNSIITEDGHEEEFDVGKFAPTPFPFQLLSLLLYTHQVPLTPVTNTLRKNSGLRHRLRRLTLPLLPDHRAQRHQPSRPLGRRARILHVAGLPLHAQLLHLHGPQRRGRPWLPGRGTRLGFRLHLQMARQDLTRGHPVRRGQAGCRGAVCALWR